MSLKLIVTVHPGDKSYRLAPSIDEITFTNPILVDWGDGNKRLYEKLSSVKHSYKQIKEKTDFMITIENDEELINIKFSEDTKLKEVRGILRSSYSVKEFFKGCRHLRYVDPNFFYNSKHQSDVSGVYMNCHHYNCNTETLEIFDKILIADNLFRNSSSTSDHLVNINWNIFKHTVSMNNMLRDNFLRDVSSIEFDKLTDVVYMNGFLLENPLIRSGLSNLSKNKNLVEIRGFVASSPNLKVDKNWLYYLPESVTTDLNRVFHPFVDINK